MMCQHFLKKTPLKPSGPGRWSGGISFKALSISSLEKGASIVGRGTTAINSLRSNKVSENSDTPNLSLKEDHRIPALSECSETGSPSEFKREENRVPPESVGSHGLKQFSIFVTKFNPPNSRSLFPVDSFGLKELLQVGLHQFSEI